MDRRSLLGAAAAVSASGGLGTLAMAADGAAARVARLSAEIERAEDLSAIKRLQRAYGYYVGRGLGSEVGELFAKDAVAEFGGSPTVGQDRIRRFFAASGPGRLPDGRLNEHILLQPIIHVAPDGMTAKGRWRLMLMTGELGKSANWGDGHYEVDYRKQDGIWKIAHLRYYRRFNAPYDGGWTRKIDAPAPAGPAPTAAPSSYPDAKPYPANYVFPFHFTHPVTGPRPAAPQPATTAASGPMDIEMLRRRAERLQDGGAIENLQGAYGFYIDKKLWDQVADLFGADASYEIGQNGVFLGQPHIREYLHSLGPKGLQDGDLFNHIQMAPVINVSPDGRTAKGRWQVLTQAGKFGKTAMWAAGIYENEYVKDGGVWKFAKMHFYTTFATPYEAGWGKVALPAENAAERTGPKPDRPPSGNYPVYPTYYLAPIHFPNPGLTPIAMPDTPKPPVAVSPSSMTRSLGSAEAMARAATDRAAVERLQHAYGFYLDAGLWDDVAGLFAPRDGSIEIGARGVYSGRDQVRKFLDVFGPVGLPPGRMSNHIQIQPVIHVAPDGRTAKVRSRAMLQAGTYGGAGNLGDGVYEDEFVKEDGVWKIKTLHFYFTFGSDYEKGWGKDAIKNPKPTPGQAPGGGPPSVAYELYPVAFIPPYHYANPVSGRK
ncbi:MAG: nuclear transport factor 2 family protein [Caulobacteraceae bacterium]